MALRRAGWMRIADKTEARGAGGRDLGPLLIAGLAWLLALGVVGFMVRADITSPLRVRQVDLNVYRNGGLSVLHGGRLYAMKSRQGLLFTYPPVAAVLAVPLGLVSWQAAELLWLPMVYIPLAVAIWFGFRPLLARARGYAPAVFAVLFGLCAYLMPMRQEMHYGQIDIFLVALCVLDCAVKRPRWPRGALIGLATAIKLVPGVFIVYLLITGRRKAAGVAALSFAAVSGLTWLIAPKDSAEYWTSAIFDSRRLGPNMQAANQSLRGMIMRLVFPTATPTAVWLGIALIVAIGGFAAARVVYGRGQEMAGIAITGMLAALLSPVAWIHHLCWIVIALGVIVGDGRNPRRVVTAVVTGAVFTSVLPIAGKDLFAAHEVPVLLARVMEDTFGLAALALIVIMYRIRPTDADTRAASSPAEPGRSAPAVDDAELAGSRNR